MSKRAVAATVIAGIAACAPAAGCMIAEAREHSRNHVRMDDRVKVLEKEGDETRVLLRDIRETVKRIEGRLDR